MLNTCSVLTISKGLIVDDKKSPYQALAGSPLVNSLAQSNFVFKRFVWNAD